MLTVKDLSKKYSNSDVYSLKNVSFDLGVGEIVGLIGKNGAGKTTLMKMLVKTLRPTTGTIMLNGINIYEKDNQLREVGILIEPAYYAQLTVLENLNFYLEVNQKTAYKQNIKKVLELVDLWGKRDRKPSSFSFGMKQRLSLAMCLVTEPKFAIMDEPFVGLDPIGVSSLIVALKTWAKEKNMTVLISSHQLAELEELCDRFLYIDQGTLTYSFEKGQVEQSNLIIHVQKDLDMTMMKENFEIAPIDVKTLLLPNNDSQINDILAYLTTNNQIISIEVDNDEQLKNYFTGE